MHTLKKIFCFLWICALMLGAYPQACAGTAESIDQDRMRELQRLGWLPDDYRPEEKPVKRETFYACLSCYLEDEKTVQMPLDKWEQLALEELTLSMRMKKNQSQRAFLSRKEAAHALADIFYIDDESDGDQLKVPLPYKDIEHLSDRDCFRLQHLRQAGIMQGDKKGTFRPREDLTHREFLQIFYRIRYPECAPGEMVELDNLVDKASMQRGYPYAHRRLAESLQKSKLRMVDAYPVSCGRIRLMGPPSMLTNSIGRPWLSLWAHYPRQEKEGFQLALIGDQGRSVHFLEKGEILYSLQGPDQIFYELICKDAFSGFQELWQEKIEGILIYDELFSEALYVPCRWFLW